MVKEKNCEIAGEKIQRRLGIQTTFLSVDKTFKCVPFLPPSEQSEKLNGRRDDFALIFANVWNFLNGRNEEETVNYDFWTCAVQVEAKWPGKVIYFNLTRKLICVRGGIPGLETGLPARGFLLQSKLFC